MFRAFRRMGLKFWFRELAPRKSRGTNNEFRRIGGSSTIRVHGQEGRRLSNTGQKGHANIISRGPAHPPVPLSSRPGCYLREAKLNGRTKRAGTPLAWNRVNPDEPLNSFLPSTLNRSSWEPVESRTTTISMSLRVLKLDLVLEQLPLNRWRSSPPFRFHPWNVKRNCETNCQFLIIDKKER